MSPGHVSPGPGHVSLTSGWHVSLTRAGRQVSFRDAFGLGHLLHILHAFPDERDIQVRARRRGGALRRGIPREREREGERAREEKEAFTDHRCNHSHAMQPPGRGWVRAERGLRPDRREPPGPRAHHPRPRGPPRPATHKSTEREPKVNRKGTQRMPLADLLLASRAQHSIPPADAAALDRWRGANARRARLPAGLRASPPHETRAGAGRGRGGRERPRRGRIPRLVRRPGPAGAARGGGEKRVCSRGRMEERRATTRSRE